MRDAFGVERGEDVSKAFSLRPVKDFVQGAKSALGGWKNPASKGGAAGAATAQRAMAAPGKIKQAAGTVKSVASAGGAAGYKAAKAKMPKPPSKGMQVLGGSIAGTGVVAGGAGYAAGKPDWQR